MPNWRDLTLTWAELKTLPESWRIKLREWRGIYHIYSTSQRKGYVGSASGAANILGHWEQYADTGHGENKHFKGLDPEEFQFSVLERLSPDAPAEHVVQREKSWKTRLHTHQYGLNGN